VPWLVLRQGPNSAVTALTGDKISETLTLVLREMVNDIKNSDDINKKDNAK
jgi:hypothetical protein